VLHNAGTGWVSGGPPLPKEKGEPEKSVAAAGKISFEEKKEGRSTEGVFSLIKSGQKIKPWGGWIL